MRWPGSINFPRRLIKRRDAGNLPVHLSAIMSGHCRAAQLAARVIRRDVTARPAPIETGHRDGHRSRRVIEAVIGAVTTETVTEAVTTLLGGYSEPHHQCTEAVTEAVTTLLPV